MASEIKIVLIGRNLIVRESLRGILSSAFQVVGSSSLAELDAQEERCAADLALVISDEWDSAMFDLLSNHFPEARTVLLTSLFDFQKLQSAFQCGVSGYLVMQTSADRLIGSLRLVAIGERVFPTELFEELAGHRLEPKVDSVEGLAAAHLSVRELEILDFLQRGFANKSIARQLQISEATVKVHLKAVFRKLNVSNRTQAAIWAVANEFADRPAPGITQESLPTDGPL